VLKGYSRGETPITCRAADVLEPELDEAKEATKDIARDIGDILTYALYPVTGMRFLRWKYGLEAPPPEVKQKTPDPVANPSPAVKEKAPPPATKAEAKETPILAPLPGVILSYEVKEGDEVKADDTVVILEAMKMANSIVTPVSGKAKAIKFKTGDPVAKDNVLLIIG